MRRVVCYRHGMDAYLTVAEAARALGLSESAVRTRVQRGVMRAERAGARLWLIPRNEVDRWRATGRLRPGPNPQRRSDDTAHPAPDQHTRADQAVR